MDHNDVIKSILSSRESLTKQLIKFCGQAMGMSPAASSPNCERMDEARFFNEVTIRYDSGEKDRFGNPVMQHFRNDLVAVIRPGRYGLNFPPKKIIAFSVGIEVKASEKDLWSDDKLAFYLGWTDFYFLAVPKYLSGYAVGKAAMVDDRIGVISICENGCVDIIKKPVRQRILASNRYAMMMELLFKDSKVSYEGSVYSYPGDAEDENLLDPKRFVQVDPVLIREDFAGKHDTYRKHVING